MAFQAPVVREDLAGGEQERGSAQRLVLWIVGEQNRGKADAIVAESVSNAALLLRALLRNAGGTGSRRRISAHMASASTGSPLRKLTITASGSFRAGPEETSFKGSGHAYSAERARKIPTPISGVNDSAMQTAEKPKRSTTPPMAGERRACIEP